MTVSVKENINFSSYGHLANDMESVWNTATNPQLYSLCAKSPNSNSLLDLCEVACFFKTRMHPYSHLLSSLKVPVTLTFFSILEEK